MRFGAKVGQSGSQAREDGTIQHVIGERAAGFGVHDVRLAKCPKVMADQGLGQAEVFHEVADAEILHREKLHDGPPHGLAQQPQQGGLGDEINWHAYQSC